MCSLAVKHIIYRSGTKKVPLSPAAEKRVFQGREEILAAD